MKNVSQLFSFAPYTFINSNRLSLLIRRHIDFTIKYFDTLLILVAHNYSFQSINQIFSQPFKPFRLLNQFWDYFIANISIPHINRYFFIEFFFSFLLPYSTLSLLKQIYTRDLFNFVLLSFEIFCFICFNEDL